MRLTKSFFKREAIFTMLFEIALPVLSLLVILILYLVRWLAR
jgi:hypothetical protein